MTRKRPTSFEVAKLAGVSRSTVSFVINGVEKANIGAATRERVLAAARELGYVPFAAGRSLASGRTNTIGLIISDAEHLRVDAFIPQLLYSLGSVAHEHGLQVIVEAVGTSGEHDPYRELVRSRRVDGLVVLEARVGDTKLSELARENFPLVILGASDVEEAYTVSTPHNALPAKRATEHLIRLGHQRIAHLSYGPLEYQGATERLQGYQQALAAADLPFDSALVREGNFSAESGFSAMSSLLESDAAFTALFASNDTVALGAMAAMRQKGVRVPDDVAVVGYDDIPLAAYAAPPLTTMRSTPFEHGRLAAQTLIKLIHGEKPEKLKVQLDLELVIRESCGAKQPVS